MSSNDTFTKYNKVSRDKSITKQPMSLLVIIVMVLVVLMMFVPHHSQSDMKSKPNQVRKTNDSVMQSELLANLQRLKSMTQHIETQNVDNNKDLQARMAAPSSMYHLDHSIDTVIRSKRMNSILQGTDANSSFANQVSKNQTRQAHAVRHPQLTIITGEFLHATLETAINSQLPGMVRAVITEDAYSYIGQQRLIPAGSRLVGQYSSGVVRGQSRVMVMWSRLILPNGVSIDINSPSVDRLGRTGQSANAIDRHFFERFGEATLLSLISTGTSLYGVSANDRYNSISEYRAAISESFKKSAEQSLKNNTAIPPTLHIYHGAALNVFVAHDLDFFPVKNSIINAEVQVDARIYRK